jgi:hypothetical protein
MQYTRFRCVGKSYVGFADKEYHSSPPVGESDNKLSGKSTPPAMTKPGYPNSPFDSTDLNLRLALSIQSGRAALPTRSKSRPLSRNKILFSFGQIVRSYGWENWLITLALVLYLLSRFIGLSDYPIFFFTDEAVQTVSAADLVRDNFHSFEGDLLPTYFYNGYQFNLSFSVYLQLIPYLLFGKSILVTRGVSVLVTALGTLSLALIMKKALKLPHAWMAVLLLSITPAWFLHSRTAFETSLATSFFALFLYFYLMYRTSSPQYIYPAVLMGALVFYSYSPSQVVIGLTALLLLISDWRYHWRQRRVVSRGFGLAILFALPFVRFMISHPQASLNHLHVLNSYWIQPLTIFQKLGRFFQEYLQGLNPLYWYIPNQVDLNRHLMKGYGHVLWITFPFLLIGLGFVISKIRKSEYRTLILALLAAPAGAAMVALGITRALVMVITLAVISAIGLSTTITWLTRKLRFNAWLPSLVIFAMFCGGNIYMTWDALTNGPLWFQDYGLGGMQYGASQIFGAIEQYHAQSQGTNIILSPSWANGTDEIARFFFGDQLPFQMGSISGYEVNHLDLDKNTLFIMIPDEYQDVLKSDKFTNIQVERTLAYPNGKAGFYFVRLQYVDNIDDILEAEREARKVLQERTVQVNQDTVSVKYSYLDMGSIENAFDGNQDTLIRTMEANPLVVEITELTGAPVSWLKARVGGTPTKVTLVLTDVDGNVYNFVQDAEESPTPRDVTFQLDQTYHVISMHVEVLSIYNQEPAHVHLWEISYGTSNAE